MATSIQRLVVVLIMIDLLFVLTGAFIYNHNDPTLEAKNYEMGYKNWSQNFVELYSEANPDTSSAYLSQQVMDDRFGGVQIFNVLSGGIQAPDLEVTEADSGGTAGKWIYWGIGFVIIVINVLGAFEIFQIFYAKKNT